MATKAEREAAAARAQRRREVKAKQAATAEKRHRAYIQRRWGIDYDALLALQGGRCAICGALPKTRRLHVDHDHDKERAGVPLPETVRGLLCIRCNHDLLGAAHDDPAIVLRAYHYLIDPPAMKGNE